MAQVSGMSNKRQARFEEGAEQQRAGESSLHEQHASTAPGLINQSSEQTQPERPMQPAEQVRQALFSGARNRMPYFRWLGPTAIMPGFKQMVVKIKWQDNDMTRSSTDGGNIMSPPRGNRSGSADHRTPSMFASTPGGNEGDARTPLNLPFYDTSPMPPSELITHLAETFFTHLGCNYPFLQRERFLRDLEEKQVDAILVDAVCAMAARFSKHNLLTQQSSSDDSKISPAEYGHAFAHRAKHALTDTFAVPSVAAAQAALLLAYNEFGEARDSGLWMYLGIAIRIAQDLGMPKRQGLKYQGIKGLTPREVKCESVVELGVTPPPGDSAIDPNLDEATGHNGADEQKAVEQERVDTFWAIFLLDRVISSGTGRRGTLRDKDIELSFPSLDETLPDSDWPAPFPALIRIVHLYGRVADMLNSIKEPSDITSHTSKRLTAMESQVTNFYQGLSMRLHFDAMNFQYYMKAGEGTNFVLLHFWFHMLIVLLHQPTLLKTFEGPMLQLFPNSQALAMSSAKTIADILSYSQLMDIKASLGNPFTTQPIYIAACAFLRETAEQTATSNAQSRAASPSKALRTGSSEITVSGKNTPQRTSKSGSSTPNGTRTPKNPTSQDRRSLAKHTLLATAATQHYQLCYKALQSLETYWAGTKYILTVLDQKFEGVGDPLLYTAEEGESAMEVPKPDAAFTTPGWRRKLSIGAYLGNPGMGRDFWQPRAGSESGDVGQGRILPQPLDLNASANHRLAIGWTLTGTMDSPSANLAWHYAGDLSESDPNAHLHPSTSDYNSSRHLTPNEAISPRHNRHIRTGSSTSQPGPDLAATRAQLNSYPVTNNTGAVSDASLLLGLNNHYTTSTNSTPGGLMPFAAPSQSYPQAGGIPYNTMHTFGDMMIESQEMDMSLLGLNMMPWFDAAPFMGPAGEFGGGMYGHADGDGVAWLERKR